MTARTKIEKAPKILSYKRELEAEHLAGKHSVEDENMTHAEILANENRECGFCQRRVIKFRKKNQRTHAFFSRGSSK